MPKTKTTPALSYARFSDAQQRGNTSVDRQIGITSDSEILKRHNLNLVEDESILLDGVSAWVPTSGDGDKIGPNLKILIEMIDSGRIKSGTTIVIEDLDRYARSNGWDINRPTEEILSRDINLLVCKPEMLITKKSIRQDISQRLMLDFMCSRGAAESDRKSDLVKGSWKAKLKNIEESSGRKKRIFQVAHPKVPDGFLVETKQDGRNKAFFATIDPIRGKVIQEMFSRVANGDTALSVANWLDKDRPIEPRTARRWTYPTVHKMLTNRSYLGEFEPTIPAGNGTKTRIGSGRIISGYYPQLIDDETFERVQVFLKSRRLAVHDPVRNSTANILTRLVKCPECGDSMVVRQMQNSAVYRSKLICTNTRLGRCSRHNTIWIPIAEASVLHAVIEELTNQKEDPEKPKTDKTMIEITSVVNKIKSLETDSLRYERQMDWANDKTSYNISYKKFTETEKQIRELMDDLMILQFQAETIDETTTNEWIKIAFDKNTHLMQAICGIEGGFTWGGLADGISVDPISDRAKIDLRAKFTKNLKQVVSRIVINDEDISINMIHGNRTIIAPILDPRFCDPHTLYNAFGSIWIKWLAFGSKHPHIEGKARAIIAMMEEPEEVSVDYFQNGKT